VEEGDRPAWGKEMVSPPAEYVKRIRRWRDRDDARDRLICARDRLIGSHTVNAREIRKFDTQFEASISVDTRDLFEI
jgi:hypothetical protein